MLHVKVKTGRAKCNTDNCIRWAVVRDKCIRCYNAWNKSAAFIDNNGVPKTPPVPQSAPHIRVVSTSPGQDRIRWIESHLRTAEDGRPLILEPFQKEFIENAFSLRTDGSGLRRYNTAVLSCGRKNGKTTLGAALGVCELCGPWTQTFTIPVASTTRSGAAVLYNQAAKMAEKSGLLGEPGNRLTGLRKKDSTKVLLNQKTGGQIITLSSDATTSIAEIPGGIIFVDELGWHKKRDLYDAMDTSRGALNPLLIVIGTLGPVGSILNDMVDSHIQNQSPTRYVQLYRAKLNCDPFDQQSWFDANPGLGTILDMNIMEDQFTEAKHDKAKLRALKHLVLNIPSSAGIEEFIGAEAWQLGTAEGGIEGPLYIGLDLSQTIDLTCMALYWPDSGRLDFRIYTITTPSLKERSVTDNIPYEDLPPGQLKIAGKYIIDYKEVAADLKMYNEQYDLQGVAADPWKLKVLKAEMEEGGMDLYNYETADGMDEALEADNEEDVEIDSFPAITTVRQDITGMSGAIDELDKQFRTGHIKHNNSILLQRCMSAIKVYVDGNLNRKFMKNKSYGRIDPMVAAAMAIGMAHDRLVDTRDKDAVRRDKVRKIFTDIAEETDTGESDSNELDPADFVA